MGHPGPGLAVHPALLDLDGAVPGVAEAAPVTPPAGSPLAKKKRKASRTPQKSTLNELHRAGWYAAMCARWIPQAVKTIDLHGFGDLHAFRVSPPAILIVQCCARSGLGAHRTKLNELAAVRDFIRAGGHVQIWAWGLVERDGDTAYCARVETASLRWTAGYAGQEGEELVWTAREWERGEPILQG